MKRFSILALLAALAVLPQAADARPGAAPRAGGTEMLSVWGVFDPGPVGGAGLGLRAMMPLAPGVLHHPRIRDEFTLEFGGDFLHYADTYGYPGWGYYDYSWNGVLAVVGATWNFWFTPRLALYPKLDLGYMFGWYDGWDDTYPYGRPSYGGVFVQGAAGVMYKLDRVSLRAELGSGLVRLGVGFAY